MTADGGKKETGTEYADERLKGVPFTRRDEMVATEATARCWGAANPAKTPAQPIENQFKHRGGLMVRAACTQASLTIHSGRLTSRQMPTLKATPKATMLNQALWGTSLLLRLKAA